ncbi:sensor histidine kinase [Nonomuraea muscovyensis]|uniref:sensor histidine kinase n=1 Tax=Nonomuraea muscovyensis TaxID=1124761 RepID=UPI003410492D
MDRPHDRHDGPPPAPASPDPAPAAPPDVAEASGWRRARAAAWWWPAAGLARGRAATAHAHVVAGGLLALLALAEAIVRARDTPLADALAQARDMWPGETVARPAPGASLLAPAGDSPPAGAPVERPGGGPVGGPVDGPVDGPVTAVYVLVFGLLALGTTLPVALLWGQPAAAAVLVTATGVLSLTAFQTMTVAGVAAQLVCGHRLGRTGSQPLAVLLAAPFVVLALAGRTGGDVRLLTLLAACLAPAAALAGIARRARGVAADDGADRRVTAEALLEHTARGERARIARELHDVVAHHISIVAVQAETARLTTPGMPAAGAERLSAIGDTARAALTEMRRLLGVLREDAGAGVTDRRPQPGLRLEELTGLLDQSRQASGTATRLILRGAPVPLDPGVELAAHRIVQEALTNTRRHAPGAAVDVELDYGADALLVRVRDNGPGPSPNTPGGGHSGGHSGGHGLTGMRERAAAVGGELRTGPAPGGGFLVEARLPGPETAAALRAGGGEAGR